MSSVPRLSTFHSSKSLQNQIIPIPQHFNTTTLHHFTTSPQQSNCITVILGFPDRENKNKIPKLSIRFSILNVLTLLMRHVVGSHLTFCSRKFRPFGRYINFTFIPEWAKK